jgi:hypothetical protein
MARTEILQQTRKSRNATRNNTIPWRAKLSSWKTIWRVRWRHLNDCNTCNNMQTSIKTLRDSTCPFLFELSFINVIITIQENFQTKSSINNINARNKHHLYRPNANLSCFQRNIFYDGIIIFNSLLHKFDNLQEWEGII